jgi:cation transport regulator ChaB
MQVPTKNEDLPDTLKRSPRKAREIYAKALDSAHEQYDSEEQAHRVAFAALKHSFEKVGDRWEAKDEPGRSEPQTAPRGSGADRPTAGGVDVVGNTKDELYQRANDLGIEGRSRMTKMELGQAIARKQD